MPERSAPAVHWVLVTLMLWILAHALPAMGSRRRNPSTACRTPWQRRGVDDLVRFRSAPKPPSSPYSTDRAPLDGAASRLVRPYVCARETAARWRRRTALVLAADFGVDLDTRDIHAVVAGGGIR
ncbi:hypothetical protein OK074_4380 [Actinobacteria bacterium OK074]|nr:hypothetical protein OK074_4380 [Actinobacteria bacterium OK074]